MIKKSFIVASLLFAGTSAVADTNKYYVGMDYQNTNYDTGVSNTTGTTTLDEKDSAYKLLVGYNYTNNLGLEVHYADFGEASLSGNNGDQFDLDGNTYQFNQTAKVTLGAKSIGLAGVGKINLSKNVNAFAKLGLHRAKVELGAVATTSDSVSETKTKPFYSVGLDFPVTSQVILSTEYSVYKFEDGDLKSLSLGLRYKF
jgi:OOP family OmpA-OmpF porin